MIEVLDYLVRNRKAKIDFAQEGYATVGTVISEMGRLGFDEEDTYATVRGLVGIGLVEPESLITGEFLTGEAVRVHASGFIHARFFVTRGEYLIGITPDLNFASREVAGEIGQKWGSESGLRDMKLGSKRRMLADLLRYFEFEYQRRCRRHAFYGEAGLGGRLLVASIQRAAEHLEAV